MNSIQLLTLIFNTFKHKYLGNIVGGTKNPHRKVVMADIGDAILKTCASAGISTTYWDQKEQETHLEVAYQKWLNNGGVWLAAAREVSTHYTSSHSATDDQCITDPPQSARTCQKGVSCTATRRHYLRQKLD